MEKITREEINKRLEKLRESRFNEESYTITKPAMAMCYSIDYIERDPAIYSCSECGKNLRFSAVHSISVQFKHLKKL